MTPIDFARNLSKSDSLNDQAMGVGIVAQGLSDDDPVTLRQGWPLDWLTVERAAEFLDLTPTPELVSEALRIVPTLSDAVLNKEDASV